MLMIGEGILSLSIVDTVPTKNYYFITTLGFITMIFIFVSTFESIPNQPAGHALMKDAFSVFFFNVTVQILSLSLIAFGVSYKSKS